MSKNRELKKRIKRLMAARGKNLTEFAKELSLPLSTVSAWMIGDNTPSVVPCLLLASKAPNLDDKIYFWGLAGLTPEIIRSAADQILEAQRVQPGEGDIIRLLPLPGGPWDQAGELPFPAARLAHPLSSYFIRFAGSSRFFFAPGDAIVVDTHDSDNPDLRPLLGRAVVVQALLQLREGDTLPRAIPEAERSLMMGRLVLMEGARQLHVQVITIGGVATAPWGIADYPAPNEHYGKRERLELLGQIRLSPAFRIVGRVEAYLPGHGRLWHEELD